MTHESDHELVRRALVDAIAWRKSISPENGHDIHLAGRYRDIYHLYYGALPDQEVEIAIAQKKALPEVAKLLRRGQ